MTPKNTQTPLNIAIFGATGGTGRHLVQQALARGHHVTASVRDPSRLDLAHPRLRVEVGDVLDEASVRHAVQGQDAVLSVIGAPARSRARLRARGTATLLRAMEAEGVDRLLSLSTYGIRDTAHVLPWFLRYLLVPLYLRPAFDDHAEQEELVEASSLCWTLVRPPTLTDGPATGSLQHGFGTELGGLALKASRADVAAFLVEELEQQRYPRRTVAIST